MTAPTEHAPRIVLSEGEYDDLVSRLKAAEQVVEAARAYLEPSKHRLTLRVDPAYLGYVPKSTTEDVLRYALDAYERAAAQEGGLKANG